MRKYFILTLSLLMVTGLLTTGCGQKTLTEKTIEKSMEKSLGGNADVDIDNNSLKMETDEGIIQVGENSELPADWPDDIYVTSGEITSSASHQDGTFNVSLTTNKSVSEVKTKYENELVSADWNITMTMSIDNSVIMGAEKDDRTLSISIAEDDGKTTVVIGTSQN